MWLFKLILVILLCLPIGYFLLFFCKKLKEISDLQDAKEKYIKNSERRRRDEARDLYFDRRSRRRR